MLNQEQINELRKHWKIRSPCCDWFANKTKAVGGKQGYRCCKCGKDY